MLRSSRAGKASAGRCGALHAIGELCVDALVAETVDRTRLHLAPLADLVETDSASLQHQLGGLTRAREAGLHAQVERHWCQKLLHMARLLHAFFRERHLRREDGASVGPPIAHLAVPQRLGSLNAGCSRRTL